ncbi:MAG: uncharacterized protein QG671_2989 [Actinomycetota bacterium]|nr:uncharacterized protein [Actinomycetota bacterium]
MATIESVVVPPQSGVAVRVPEGAALRITDREGQQVSDMFAVFSDLSDFLSARTSRAASWRLFPKVGDPFVSVNYRPMFLFEEDNTPGAHDLLAPPCSAEMYELLGSAGYHPSCSDNFRAAAHSVGWNPEVVPDPVDWFQNTPVDGAGQISVRTALTRPGDSVTLRALADMFVVVTACSMDLPDKKINGDSCTSIGVEVIA